MVPRSTNDGKLSDSKSSEFSVVVDSEGKGKLSGDCTQQQKHGKRSKQNLDHAHVERMSRHSSPSKKLLARKGYCEFLNYFVEYVTCVARNYLYVAKLLLQFWLPHPTIKEPKDARGKAVMVIEDEIMHILVAEVMKKSLTLSPTHCEDFVTELAGRGNAYTLQ
ncbi:hypothetical protein VNO78_01321 [Psophocarpus tetragonolobus]|uniref:Uncharacterized protein n=1 Tax=Psophocarpus tetragonolobus TaxID=3891 RepID=A0AAN9T0B3_PSOTE